MEKNDIYNLVASGNTEKALKKIFESIPTNHESFEDFILYNARYSTAKTRRYRGLMNEEDFNVEINKINQAILKNTTEIIDQLTSYKNEDQAETVRFLFLTSLPYGTEKLQLEKEYLDIRRALKRKIVKFEIIDEFNVTLEALFDEIKIENPTIVQFSGHASKDELILSDSSNTQHMVPWEFLVPPFKLLSDTLECVFIHAVHSRGFAKKLSAFIPITIGIEGDIVDEHAVSFASSFYSSLSMKKDYELAFMTASKVLESAIISTKLPINLVDYKGDTFEVNSFGNYCMFIRGEEYLIKKNTLPTTSHTR